MLEHFLQLPTSVQTILASITPITVEWAAEVADRILEVSTPNVSLSTNAIVSSNENRILQEIERLNKRIDDLTLSHREEVILDPEIAPEIVHFHVPGNLIFVSITASFKKGPRNAFHLAAINEKTNPARIASSLEAEHIQHLHLLFDRLDQYGLSINPSKCTFGVTTLKFLGFQVCRTGIKPLEDRVEAILKFPQPTTITRFHGMLNYYRRFIRQAAHILVPLVKFLKGIRNKKKKKNRPKRNDKIKPEEVLEWTDEATTSIEMVMQALAQATLLHHPMPNAPLSIRHVPGTQNLVADTLFPIEIDSISKASYLDYKDIAAAQLVDDELKHLLEFNSTSLTLKQQYFPLEDITLTCDVSTNVSRLFIPKDYRRIVSQHLHGLPHPGIAASTKMVTQRFVWPNIRRKIQDP
ncbi:transposon Tf2-6 polyprotein [Nephila pilipes]|uniref:RNA-directed DNA polymerase n=1 Tax=Nephila pilipes TaxID=299642 RepID=A0A8X6NGG1_NEPPI|nr:transposon Tf2-6 polyprotein [Nephila pilipes]